MINPVAQDIQNSIKCKKILLTLSDHFNFDFFLKSKLKCNLK